MIVAIHQPQYLPWLGYFDKIDRADTFVLLDDVQYKKNEWQNRNKIRTANGWQWITVPVRYRFGEEIDQVKINANGDWRKDHCQSLMFSYNRAPFFKEYEAFFKMIYERDWEYLVDINIHFIEYLVKSLGISTRLIKASGLEAQGQKTERLVEICKRLEADTYLSGEGGKEYLDLDCFKRNKIKVVFQKFKHPVYRQVYSGFEPFMSIVDLLFNYGDNSLKILKGQEG